MNKRWFYFIFINNILFKKMKRLIDKSGYNLLDILILCVYSHQILISTMCYLQPKQILIQKCKKYRIIQLRAHIPL